MRSYWQDEHFKWNDVPDAVKWTGEWADYAKLTPPAGLEYLILWHHKSQGNLAAETRAPALRFLEINWSNAVSIGELPATVRRFAVYYGKKLENIRGLPATCPELKHLRMETCRKFDDLESIQLLAGLEVLCLNACGPLPNLQFLENLPKLRDFRFVDTNVLDGDLTPILAHPRLENAGFLDKRKYSHKSDDINARLASRLGAN